MLPVHVRLFCITVCRRTVVIDGLLLRVFDRVRQTAMYGCCDDPACDLQLMLHQFTLRAVERVRVQYGVHATAFPVVL